MDANRKMALVVNLVLEGSPLWLVLITEFLLLPGAKVPIDLLDRDSSASNDLITVCVSVLEM